MISKINSFNQNIQTRKNTPKQNINFGNHINIGKTSQSFLNDDVMRVKDRLAIFFDNIKPKIENENIKSSIDFLKKLHTEVTERPSWDVSEIAGRLTESKDVSGYVKGHMEKISSAEETSASFEKMMDGIIHIEKEIEEPVANKATEKATKKLKKDTLIEDKTRVLPHKKKSKKTKQRPTKQIGIAEERSHKHLITEDKANELIEKNNQKISSLEKDMEGLENLQLYTEHMLNKAEKQKSKIITPIKHKEKLRNQYISDIKSLDNEIENLSNKDYSKAIESHTKSKPTLESAHKECEETALQVNKKQIKKYSQSHTKEETNIYKQSLIDKYTESHLDKTFDKKNNAWTQQLEGLQKKHKDTQAIPTKKEEKAKLAERLNKFEQETPELAPILIKEKEAEIREIGKRIKSLEDKDFDKLIENHKNKEPKMKDFESSKSFEKESDKWQKSLNKLEAKKSEAETIPQMREKMRSNRRAITKLKKENPDFAFIAKKQKQVQTLLDEKSLEKQIQQAEQTGSLAEDIAKKKDEISSILDDLNYQNNINNIKTNLKINTEISKLKNEKNHISRLEKNEKDLQSKLLPVSQKLTKKEIHTLKNKIVSNQENFQDTVTRTILDIKKNTQIKKQISALEPKTENSKTKINYLSVHSVLAEDKKEKQKSISLINGLLNSIVKKEELEKSLIPIPKEMEEIVNAKAFEKLFNSKDANNEKLLNNLTAKAQANFKEKYPEHKDIATNETITTLKNNIKIEAKLKKIKAERSRLSSKQHIEAEINNLKTQFRPIDKNSGIDEKLVEQTIKQNEKMMSLKKHSNTLTTKKSNKTFSDSKREGYRKEQEITDKKIKDIKTFFKENPLKKINVEDLSQDLTKKAGELEHLQKEENKNIQQYSLKDILKHQLKRIKKFGTRSKTRLKNLSKSRLHTAEKELKNKKTALINQSKTEQELDTRISVLKNDLSNTKDQITSRKIQINRLTHENDSLTKRKKAPRVKDNTEKENEI